MGRTHQRCVLHPWIISAYARKASLPSKLRIPILRYDPSLESKDRGRGISEILSNQSGPSAARSLSAPLVYIINNNRGTVTREITVSS